MLGDCHDGVSDEAMNMATGAVRGLEHSLVGGWAKGMSLGESVSV